MSQCPPSMSSTLFHSGAGLSCTVDTGYSLYVITAVPTADEIRKICASSECKRAISVIRGAQPTDCITGRNFKIYDQIINPIEAGCKSGGGGGGGPPPAPPPTAAPPTAPPPTAPPPTAPPPTPAPPPPPTAPPSPATTPSSPAIATKAPDASIAPSGAPVSGGGNGTSMPEPISSDRNGTGGAASTSNTKTTESSGSSNTTVIIAIVAGVVVVIAIVAFIAFRAGRRKNSNNNGNDRSPRLEVSPAYAAVPSNRKYPSAAVARPAVPQLQYEWAAAPRPMNVASPTAPTLSSGARSSLVPSNGSTSVASAAVSESAVTVLSKDSAIQKARIPLEDIMVGDFLSNGAFGEVLKGSYNGEPVAIKRLVPDRRKDMKEIESFLEEAKLLISLKHPRIVSFIGVAWDSFADTCIVTELMEGGDLRTMLNHADINNDPTGFDANKVKIALHIVHALSYLHGLKPPVVHRDLKSKNVLLTRDLDAKLTDFGVSRERADSTMTSNVGSSLWMAPEVMLGERYDEKADIYSFGVIVSELDTQKLPYSDAKEPGSDRKLPEMALLNKVSAGHLTVAFTDGADEDMVQVGLDCVAVDPKKRPTASEVLHRMHKIYRDYLHV